jgi:rhodanese-related sulfurtransferase
MKRILFLSIILLFAANTPVSARLDTLPNDLGKTISTPEGLKNVIDSKDSKFVIVDVRNESAYENGHIPTAINIPRGFISDIKNPPSKDKYLILYCFGGLTSPSAGQRLQSDGYKYIFVWGGISDWPYELEKSTK